MVKKVEIFLKFADLIEENTNDIIEICAKESGKSIKNSIAEIREAVDFCRYYSKEALNLFQTQTLKGPTGELNQYRMIGKGLSFVISPWNFPVAIFVGQTVAALITGNVVITKPAEQSSFAAYYIIKLLLKAGLPSNAIALLLGDGALIGKKVINDKKLKNIISVIGESGKFTTLFSLKSFIIFSEFNAIKVNEEIKNRTIDILIITRK